MLYKAIASSIMASVLSSVKKEAMESAKAQLLKNQMNLAREAMLAHVAEQYSREVEYNVSRYIESLSKAEVEISFKGKPGEALITRAETAITELESYLDAQNPDGAVIQYLKQRYSEEGINIITGKLYASHYVQRKSQGTYEVLNRMGYAAPVDARRPWLSGEKTIQGIEEIISRSAAEIFEIVFDDIDLSGELATLKFSGEGAKLAKTNKGQGFNSSKSTKKKTKKRS